MDKRAHQNASAIFSLLLGVALAGATGLTGAGCSSADAYAYVNVRVTIDRNTVSENQRFLITSCEFQVRGAEVTEAYNVRCPENHVSYDVGTFQWTTSASTGALQFFVQVFDANHAVIGEGTSDDVPVTPGKVLSTSVLVTGVAAAGGADGGAD